MVKEPTLRPRPVGCLGASQVTYDAGEGLLVRAVACNKDGCPRKRKPLVEAVRIPKGTAVAPEQLLNIQTSSDSKMYGDCQNSQQKASFN